MAGESEPIKSTDLFSQDFLDQPIQKFALLKDAITQVEDAIKKVSSNTAASVKGIATPDSVEDIEKLNAAYAKLKQSEAGLTEVQKLNLQAQQKLNEAKRNYRTELKGEESAYAKLNNQLGVSRQKAKDLAVQYGLNSKQFKDAAKEVHGLDGKLKKIDSTLGLHQRNVGNYSGAIRPLTQLLHAIGAQLGIDTEMIVSFGHELHATEQLHRIFHKTSKDVTDQLKDEALAQQQSTEAKIAGNDATETSATLTETETAAIETNTTAKDAQATANAAVGESAAAATPEIEAMDAAMDANPIALLVVALAALAAAATVVYTAFFDNEKESEKLEFQYEQLKAATEDLKKVTDAQIGVMESQLQLMKDQGASQDEILAQEQNIYNAKKAQIEADIALQKSSIAVTQAQLQEADSTNILTGSLDVARKATVAYQLQKQGIAATDANINKYYNQIFQKDLVDKLNTAKATILADQADLQKLDYDFQDKQIQTKKDFQNKMSADDKKAAEDAIYWKTHEADTILQYDKSFYKQEADLAAQSANESKDLRDKLAGQLETGGLDSGELKAQMDALVQAQKDAADKIKKINEDLTNAIKNGVNARFTYQQTALQQQTSLIDSQLTTQEQLFKDGLSSTLAFEQKARADAAADAVKLAKKKKKEENAIELGNLFLKLVASYATTDKDGSSIRKALQQTLLAKGLETGLEAAFGGSAFEGTADTGAAGNLDDKGGKLWMLHPHEAVIPEKANTANPGLAAAIIAGKVDDYFANVYLPNFAATVADDSVQARPVNRVEELLKLNFKASQEIKKAIEGKREFHWDVNKHNEWTLTQIEQGVKRVITYKPRVR